MALDIPHPRVADDQQTQNLDRLKPWAEQVDTDVAALETADAALDTRLDTVEDLASDTLAAYRTLQTTNIIGTGLGSITTTVRLMRADGVIHVSNTGFAWQGLYIDPADYAVTGKSTKLRVRAQIVTNGTDPNIDVTVGLYPVTAWGGSANLLAYSVGTVLGSVTFTNATLGVNNCYSSAGSDFDIPSAGNFALGVVGSSSQAANSALGIMAQLQLRHI